MIGVGHWAAVIGAEFPGAADTNGSTNTVCYTFRVRYFIQFTAGIGDLVRQSLAGELSRMRVEYADDSAMIFEAGDRPGLVAVLPYVKNAFLVVASVGRSNLDASVAKLASKAKNASFPRSPDRGYGFRLMFHIDGSLVPVSSKSKGTLERAVAARTGRRVEPRGNCQEYWVVGRTTLEELLLCMRLPKPSREEKARGAISHELSAALVAASGPDPRDVFLDPFGGSGSFAAARLEHPVQRVWYSDTRLADHLPAFVGKLRRDDRVRLLNEDALRLRSIPDGSVDVIVTDPPWGEHEDLDRPYPEFAASMAASFARVLRPGTGRYVVLVNRDNAAVMRQALSAAGITPDDEHEVLVNGHPATVLVRRPARRRAKQVGSPRLL